MPQIFWCGSIFGVEKLYIKAFKDINQTSSWEIQSKNWEWTLAMKPKPKGGIFWVSKDLTVWDNLHTVAHKSLNLTLGKIVSKQGKNKRPGSAITILEPLGGAHSFPLRRGETQGPALFTALEWSIQYGIGSGG